MRFSGRTCDPRDPKTTLLVFAWHGCWYGQYLKEEQNQFFRFFSPEIHTTCSILADLKIPRLHQLCIYILNKEQRIYTLDVLEDFCQNFGLTNHFSFPNFFILISLETSLFVLCLDLEIYVLIKRMQTILILICALRMPLTKEIPSIFLASQAS